MKLQSFAELKRVLIEGTVIRLIDSSINNHKGFNKDRAVVKAQTNAVKLSDGSWLGLGSTGEKAGDFSFFDGGFKHEWDKGTGFQGFNTYLIIKSL